MKEPIEAHDELSTLRIVHALEQAPGIAVPANFTARVMARVPASSRRPARRWYRLSPQRYGLAATAASLLLLLIAMLALAPRTAHSASWLLMQTLLFCQFCALLLWLGARAFRRV